MANQLVFHPGTIWGPALETLGSAVWSQNAQFTISAGIGSAGVAMPFLGDGTGIKTVKVYVRSGSQAGTLKCSIQTPDPTEDVNHISGLPSGTIITNGSTTASVTGAVNEYVTLTFTTAPTPTGFHWLVFESTGVTHDIELAYTADWMSRTFPLGRMFNQYYHDGVDWNNQATIGKCAADMLDASGNSITHFYEVNAPVLGDFSNFLERIGADNKEMHGFRFTAKDNLTNLYGVTWPLSGLGADMEVVMKLATAAGSVVATSSIFCEQHMPQAGRNSVILFNDVVTLTPGTDYRLLLQNNNDTADDVWLQYFNLSASTDQTKYFGMDDGEFAYTSAIDPPEWGASGVGTWTDDNTHLVPANLIFSEDIPSISGGGGNDSVVSYAC